MCIRDRLHRELPGTLLCPQRTEPVGVQCVVHLVADPCGAEHLAFFAGALLLLSLIHISEPDRPFWDGLGSDSLCSDKKVKNLLRLLREDVYKRQGAVCSLAFAILQNTALAILALFRPLEEIGRAHV